MRQDAFADGTLVPALRQEIAASGLPIVAAYLFGSTARGQAGPASDVDVAVLFDRAVNPTDSLSIAARLQSMLERVAPRDVQVVILNDASPLLRHRVLRDGLVLAGADDPRRVRFEAAAMCEYLDLVPMIERYDAALLARARAGRLGA